VVIRTPFLFLSSRLVAQSPEASTEIIFNFGFAVKVKPVGTSSELWNILCVRPPCIPQQESGSDPYETGDASQKDPLCGLFTTSILVLFMVLLLRLFRPRRGIGVLHGLKVLFSHNLSTTERGCISTFETQTAFTYFLLSRPLRDSHRVLHQPQLARQRVILTAPGLAPCPVPLS
jgi:hypothetical protein